MAAANKFKELVEEHSSGGHTVEVRPNGVLISVDTNTDEIPLDEVFAITLTDVNRLMDAIHHLAPPHAKELDLIPIWSASARPHAEGATLIVTSDNSEVQAKIRGLGFLRLTATGNCHQDHHLAIARGEMVHQHH